jgi:hypothetical protein
MPDECEAELRDSFDGAKLCLTRQGELSLSGVVETQSGKVNLILATELVEGGDNVTYKLRLIAADTSRPGTAFRLDPDELCLVHRPTETRVFGKWNREFHYLEFSDLRMRNEYIAVFTTATGGVFARTTLPGFPDGAEG